MRAASRRAEARSARILALLTSRRGMLTTLAVVAATVVGTMVGVEFAVAVFVNPIFLRMPVGAAIEARRRRPRPGPRHAVLVIASLILTTGLAVAARGAPATSAAAVGAGLLAVSVVMSVTLLVPINNRSATWTADHHPADWREQSQRWDRLHYARVAIILAGSGAPSSPPRWPDWPSSTGPAAARLRARAAGLRCCSGFPGLWRAGGRRSAGWRSSPRRVRRRPRHRG